MRGLSVLIVAMSGALAGQASGQLAPPPPKESTKTDLKYVPPPPPPPVRQTPAGGPQAQPVRDAAGHIHQAPARGAAPQSPATPDLPFVPLVRSDGEGGVIPVGGQIAMAALKHNPLVGAETVEAVRPVVIEWVDRLDLMVIDDIDMVLEVDAGFFETLDFLVQEGVMAANVYRSSLMPKPSLLDQHLFSQGVLTQAQKNFNGRLIGDYVRATTLAIGDEVESAWVARVTAENGGVPRDMTAEETVAMRREFMSKASAFTFWYLCADSVWSMKRQLAFAADHLGEILPELDLDDEQMERFKQTQSALGQTADPGERARLMVELITPWDFDNQESLMLTALDIRGPLKTLAELEDAVNKPDGLEPREDLKNWKPGDPIDAPDAGSGKNSGDGG